MPVDPRPAMPTIPPRQAAFRTRRAWLLAKLATSVTVLTAANSGFCYLKRASTLRLVENDGR